MENTTPGRPKLGQRIRATDHLMRRQPRTDNGDMIKKWMQRGETAHLKAKPVAGIYAGYRTYSNGIGTYLGYDDGWRYTATDHFEVWLIIPGERMKPVPVLPGSVTFEEKKRRANG